MTTKKTATKKPTTGCGGCGSSSFNEERFAKAMVMASLLAKGGNMNQIEETANFVIGKVYGSTEG